MRTDGHDEAGRQRVRDGGAHARTAERRLDRDVLAALGTWWRGQMQRELQSDVDAHRRGRASDIQRAHYREN